jgi:hypothetical protein
MNCTDYYSSPLHHEPIVLCFSIDLHQKKMEKKYQETSQEQEHHRLQFNRFIESI